ncbi:amino acid ABC transporter permease [Cryobacterium psychrophilum]|uniref:Amino acid ABC transporter permease n=1 Tax=Cryobacterium psychrophilum TaxID=41988 RepID=A0A4Y8KUP9_9MICO|nr:amino acid ABC transporter permease [Cryobacterium psychrophilum]TDW30483.1 amino acid ABC transporter membrane protein (PAAT family) [Cryobacterium psychrophilum]TFD79555.1 amino acid ABC transporter permease [Cryobacterium psychrophilum]
MDGQPASSGTKTPIRAIPVRHWGQQISGVIVVAVLAAFLYAVATNDNLNWSVIAANLFGPTILSGLWVTISLTILSMIIGVILGVSVAVMRLSPNRVLNSVAGGYIWVFRGTPVLVQLLLWFNMALFFPRLGLGEFSLDTNTVITAFVAALLGLGLNEGAYMAEIVRGGILSVDHGQSEASMALGMRRRSTMFKIVLPQAMRVIIPPMGNQVITMLKMTSLVTVIAAPDLLNRAQVISSRNFYIFELLIVASIWYLALTTISTLIQMRLEKRFARGVAGTAPRRQRVLRNLKPGRATSPVAPPVDQPIVDTKGGAGS